MAELGERPIVIAGQPKARHFDKLRPQIQALLDKYPGLASYYSITPEPEASMHELYEHVQKDALLALVGGDGTFHHMVRNLLREHPDKYQYLPSTLLAFCGSGGQSDIPRELHGPNYANLARILEGNEILIPSLEIAYTDPSGQQMTKHGIYSFGLNIIGEGAEMANHDWFRQLQRGIGKIPGPLDRLPIDKMADLALAAVLLGQSKGRRITLNGETFPIIAMIISSSNIMAGLWEFPERLDRRCFMASIMRYGWLKTPLYAASVLSGIPYEGLEDLQELTLYVEEPMTAEIDGEPFHLGVGPVTVKLGPDLRMLSTELEPGGSDKPLGPTRLGRFVLDIASGLHLPESALPFRNQLRIS